MEADIYQGSHKTETSGVKDIISAGQLTYKKKEKTLPGCKPHEHVALVVAGCSITS
jgi:hypothetical protein